MGCIICIDGADVDCGAIELGGAIEAGGAKDDGGCISGGGTVDDAGPVVDPIGPEGLNIGTVGT